MNSFAITYAAVLLFTSWLAISGFAVYFWLRLPSLQHLKQQDFLFRVFVYYGIFFTGLLCIGVLLSFVGVIAFVISGAIYVPR